MRCDAMRAPPAHSCAISHALSLALSLFLLYSSLISNRFVSFHLLQIRELVEQQTREWSALVMQHMEQEYQLRSQHTAAQCELIKKLSLQLQVRLDTPAPLPLPIPLTFQSNSIRFPSRQ